MKRFSALVLAMILLVCISVSTALGENGAWFTFNDPDTEACEEDGYTTYYVVNCNDWVSLRRYPAQTSERLTTVPFGEAVDVFGYENGFYLCEYGRYTGYIDVNYLSTEKPSRRPGGGQQSVGARDLSNFGWRTVCEKGRGRLVFQTKPGGKAIPGFKYHDGDSIYVNLYYRETYKGKWTYTLAYMNGTYGYVDASYINW